jgi:magnesium chelatase family protein
LTETEALEVASIYSLTQRGFDFSHWARRPFRVPHHTASGIALVGGGNPPRPGEISLAHRGVLFLDELPEFSRVVLEVLREPLEAGEVMISRACHQAVFPARFQLVAAMNPCPCGYHGDEKGRCRCTLEQIQRYQHKISGPLLDRIDMHLTIKALPPSVLLGNRTAANEASAIVRARVECARAIQRHRQQKINADLTQDEISHYCPLQPPEQQLLMQAVDSLGLSARAYHRILRLARTIADMDQAGAITGSHLHEAISYRGG